MTQKSPLEGRNGFLMLEFNPHDHVEPTHLVLHQSANYYSQILYLVPFRDGLWGLESLGWKG